MGTGKWLLHSTLLDLNHGILQCQTSWLGSLLSRSSVGLRLLVVSAMQMCWIQRKAGLHQSGLTNPSFSNSRTSTIGQTRLALEYAMVVSLWLFLAGCQDQVSEVLLVQVEICPSRGLFTMNLVVLSAGLPVSIGDSPAIMFKGMEGSTLGVWSAHGEARAFFPDENVLATV